MAAGRLATLLLALGLPWFLAMDTAKAQQGDMREELQCLALNIYFEARDQPELGQLAVGHVVLNRVRDPRFPNTICGVVRDGGQGKRHRCQFSWWCDGESDKPRDARAWAKSMMVANYVYWGFSKDPTYGALWYHADYVRPVWRKSLLRGPGIGSHIFYLQADGKRLTPDRRATRTEVSQGDGAARGLPAGASGLRPQG